MRKVNILTLLPIFFAFFVMGFVDVVGIATEFVKADFGLSEQVSGFLPSIVFLWFLLLAIPSASIMNRIGRKNTVLLSMGITLLGMIIPFVSYNLTTCFVAFAFLGIGNTILQVSLNPLVSNFVKGEMLTSSLTIGQVLKAVSSFCGPFIASFALLHLGNWQYIFPIFACIVLLSGLWLMLSPVKREEKASSTSIKEAFSLLGNKNILLLFLGIVAVVGVDVGINMVSVKLLLERLGLDPTLHENIQSVSYAPSVYFLCRTVGAFVGAAVLTKMNTMKYFKINMIGALVFMLPLFLVQNKIVILVFIGALGYSCSSIFSIIFSMAMRIRPDKANEISGLMVTGIVGGAIVPPLMTAATRAFGNTQNGALSILVLAIIYLIFLAFKIKEEVK
jgi:fucose permease